MPANLLPAGLCAVLKTYSETAQRICESFASRLRATPPPPIIYHYTDDHGLRGILETGQLWFTDIFSLNDPSEFTHGLEHAFDILRSATDNDSPEAGDFFKRFYRALNGRVEFIAHFYVCCFSKMGDDLGQWRAYADDGHGYAIGFDAAALEAAFKGSEMPATGLYSTFPLTYQDDELRTIYKHLAKRTIAAISTCRVMDVSKEVESDFLKCLSIELAERVFEMSLYFKHEAYSNEVEYRFVQTYPASAVIPDVKFRSRPYSLVKYREFDWRNRAIGSIKKIICGPAGKQESAFKFACDCIREYAPVVGITPIKSVFPIGALGCEHPAQRQAPARTEKVSRTFSPRRRNAGCQPPFEKNGRDRSGGCCARTLPAGRPDRVGSDQSNLASICAGGDINGTKMSTSAIAAGDQAVARRRWRGGCGGETFGENPSSPDSA